MNILVVGAGAVGQVLGAHLQNGGAEVAVLVKEKHAAEARRGFELRALHKKETLRFAPEVLTSMAEAVKRPWQLIVLCTSSTALRSGPWLDELAKAEGTFVAIQPGLEDPDYVRARVGDRVVWGMFPLVAFADGEVMSYYLPPLGKLPFSGPQAAVVVDALNRGKLAARVHRDVPSAMAFSNPLLEVLIMSLEIAGWKLAAVGPQLGDAVKALREALDVVARHRQAPAPFLFKLIRPWMLRLALPVVKLAPFSVEDYVRRHFTKVGDQTVAGIDTWIGYAGKYQLPSDALSRMRGKLLERRAA
jgi:2-dehydropantoate 2-reductase